MMSEEETVNQSEANQELGLADWVEQTLLIMEYPARQGGAFCAKWWLHPEAVARFKALRWQYYKSMQEGDISSWWVNHWDGHVKALFDPQTGVFRDCSAMHRPGETVRVRDAAYLESGVGSDPAFLKATQSITPYW